MAVTKLWSVTERLGQVIDYATNPEKTSEAGAVYKVGNSALINTDMRSINVDYEGMEENPSNYYDIMAVYMVNRCGGRANLH